MNLEADQRKKVVGWIEQGLKLSEIQNRLAMEFGSRLTYMEVRLLVDDLKLTPKDAIRIAPTQASAATQRSIAEDVNQSAVAAASPPNQPGEIHGEVSVSIDQLAKPGTLASGKVSFSDGQKAEWYLDETGRLGVLAEKQGYRPSPGDLQQFQAKIQVELRKIGL